MTWLLRGFWLNLGKLIDTLTPEQAYYVAHWDLDQ